MKIQCVIGAGHGDEGKGLVTDYLASKVDRSAAVVRFNGGAQAGHTVQLANGDRHVFSHFGSGSLRGLPTILSNYFVLNPVLFFQELERLLLLTSIDKLQVFVSGMSPITTPFDVAINQVVENRRSKFSAQHGSCGVGFGETISRVNNNDITFSIRDIRAGRTWMEQQLWRIYNEWVPKRLISLGINPLSVDFDEVWPFKTREQTAHIIEVYIDTALAFLEHVIPMAEYHSLNSFDELIFEGAQGLMLDQEYGTMPYCTPSSTGIKNVLNILKSVRSFESPIMYYLTRAYATRHGAGPLAHECSKPIGVVDNTNLPHDFQGNLRFGYLDIAQYKKVVNLDLQHQAQYEDIHISTVKTVVTCCDQLSDGASYFTEFGDFVTEPANKLIEAVGSSILSESILFSNGPTAENINVLW